MVGRAVDGTPAPIPTNPCTSPARPGPSLLPNMACAVASSFAGKAVVATQPRRTAGRRAVAAAPRAALEAQRCATPFDGYK